MGKQNNWKVLLDENIINKIEKKFYHEMKELDYL